MEVGLFIVRVEIFCVFPLENLPLRKNMNVRFRFEISFLSVQGSPCHFLVRNKFEKLYFFIILNDEKIETIWKSKIYLVLCIRTEENWYWRYKFQKMKRTLFNGWITPVLLFRVAIIYFKKCTSKIASQSKS